ncbi:hypothetical protein [Methylocucumis oryzae]|uniref:Uncharacterized protein n=1 Tax=Methylocucumis oryzae TaxID=1632867 RepID=A0A0F3IIU7_9GAMM|nr:hypothetical protein [Methylocucumis oryzae]KJV05439.1 hypothetical protein VZ94_18225 [Methylocucumis oryzae]
MTTNQAAYADQPAALTWKILEAAKEGTALAGYTQGGDSRLLVQLSPWDLKQRTPLLVVFRSCGGDPIAVDKPMLNFEAYMAGKDTSPIYDPDWKAPEPRWRLCPETDAVLVYPNATAPQQVLLNVDFLRLANEGMSPRIDMAVYNLSSEELKIWPTAEELARNHRNQPPDAIVPLTLHYRLTRNKWVMGSYASIFGAPSRDLFKGGKSTGDYEKLAKTLPVNLESFRRKIYIPDNTDYDRLESIKQALEISKARGTAGEGEQICYPENTTKSIATAPIAPRQPLILFQDVFSTRWSADHSLHSGFGFRVEVYRAGSSTMLGSAWVEANGLWSVNIPDTAGFVTSQQINVYYRSYNSYYAPQNQAGNKYWWYDPTWTVTSTSFNVGHRTADTDGGTYNGVGELVDSAMTMWSRLYWDAGINPVPSSAIRFFFPNTWNNCGGDSPWSCASGNDIWLIASHGVQGDVVNHEMAHVLNNKFWENKRPAGSGGSHSLNTCYPTRLGMALREGFANYIAAWVGYPARNIAEGGFNSGRWALGWDAEQRNTPPDCTNGWENEVWVARTFWDLHDTRSDGDDILWFNSPGAVIALYLGNGIANDGDARDMRYYEDIYRDAASAGHAGFITDIFEQNHH